jgi:hypothetical protein
MQMEKSSEETLKGERRIIVNRNGMSILTENT